MSRFLAAAFLALAGCSTGGGLATRALEIGPDSPITVEITRVQGWFSNTSSPVELSVDVENISDFDVTIQRITVQSDGRSAFAFDAVTKQVNELISEHENFTLDLNTWGRQTRSLRPNEASEIVLFVRVQLTNGDSYTAGYSVRVESSGRF